MGNISVFISAGDDKRIVEEVQGCVYAGMFLENNGKIKIRPMCMRNSFGCRSCRVCCSPCNL